MGAAFLLLKILTHTKELIMEFTAFSRQVIDQLESDITAYLQACKLPSPLHEASLYAMTNGGKRVRPLLIAATFATVKTESSLTHPSHQLSNDVRRAMMAVECLHGYSLVHDDLPCMDDDALRRGRPTTHIAYGEAAAMLAGDVLQTLAFEALTHTYFGKNSEFATPLSATFAPRARRMVMG
ncbi:MAG TPA: farnesyl-diphosphate synthase, partial [Moraxella sp.]|nr:farnesyl-diphosphate synthase [Moraxella sp.]